MKKILVSAAIAAAALVAGQANANSDGVLSDTSSVGTLNINATVVPMVSIRGLDDMTFTINSAAINGPSSHAVIGISNFCVFSNVDADGSYNIKAEGSGAASAFTLAGAGTSTALPYIVHLLNTAGTNPNNGNANSGQVKNFNNTDGGQARATDLNCSNAGGENAGVSVRVTDTAALAALADTYTGVLTVTVSVP
jgi:hypothetical protein